VKNTKQSLFHPKTAIDFLTGFPNFLLHLNSIGSDSVSLFKKLGSEAEI